MHDGNLRFIESGSQGSKNGWDIERYEVFEMDR
jgi:hypothetical protein